MRAVSKDNLVSFRLQKSRSGRSAGILVVASDAHDAFLISQAIERSAIKRCVEVVADGENAVAFLRRRTQGDGEIPEIILIDWSPDRAPAFEALLEINGNCRLHTAMLIVASDLQNSSAAQTAFELGVNCFIARPATPQDFVPLCEWALNQCPMSTRPPQKPAKRDHALKTPA